ncbi:MAG TPA: DsbA family protein, partial [Gammaproteobacteria bacterium]|nr:DsbA family protein [Gammaproteobacteria bacterium]
MNATHVDLAVPVSAADHTLGPDHAPVAVVEYGDFECPNCKNAAPAVKMLLADHGDRLRFVYRHFPLEEPHPHALAAAEAAECAAGQGKFWEMHDLLFANQAHLSPKHLHGYAERLGLDLPRYTAEMDDHIYLQRIREHMAGGKRSHVRGTPGFFV